MTFTLLTTSLIRQTWYHTLCPNSQCLLREGRVGKVMMHLLAVQSLVGIIDQTEFVVDANQKLKRTFGINRLGEEITPAWRRRSQALNKRAGTISVKKT